MAGLSPSDIASPIRRILRYQKNAEVILAEARLNDLAAPHGRLGRRLIAVRLSGRGHRRTGMPTSATTIGCRCPGTEEHREMRGDSPPRALGLQLAKRDDSPERQQAWLTFVIVGGGPTGVELAGALTEIARR